MTITEVENKYKRPPDTSDGSYNPEEPEVGVQVEHFALFEEGAAVNRATDSVRIHGYYRSGGYFVITRLDWGHRVHS